MPSAARKFDLFVWSGVILLTGTLLLGLMLGLLRMRPTGPRLPVLGQVGDFTLTNQDNHVITLADLKGRVWIADIIFTRCAGPCPRMTRQMKELQDRSAARLVSLTTDPDYDSPAVLKKYAERFGADPARWIFLTGPKDQIARLAIDSLKLTAVEKKPEERQSPQDLFIHSTIFVLVDKQARLRGVFETGGDGADWAKARDSLLAVERRLERER